MASNEAEQVKKQKLLTELMIPKSEPVPSPLKATEGNNIAAGPSPAGPAAAEAAGGQEAGATPVAPDSQSSKDRIATELQHLQVSLVGCPLTADMQLQQDAIEKLMAGEKLNVMMTKEERSAQRKKFHRSLEPATQRLGRTEKCPEDIALNIKADKTQHTPAYYFNLWQSLDNDWGQKIIREKIIKTLTNKTTARKVWRMENEIRDMHPQIIADHVLQVKKADPSLWRPHPDAPGLKEAIQYLVFLDEVEEHSEKQEHIAETVFRANLDQEAARAILPERMAVAPDAAGVPLQHEHQAVGVAGTQGLQGKEKSQKEVEAEAKKEERERLSAESKRKRAEQKDKEKEEAKERKEALENAPETKASKQITNLAKQIGCCNDFIGECKSASTDIPAPKKTSFAKMLEMDRSAMKKLRTTLVEGHGDSLQQTLDDTERAVKSFQETVKAWKKFKSAHSS